jgi:sugar phosphate isomerase/epimerase
VRSVRSWWSIRRGGSPRRRGSACGDSIRRSPGWNPILDVFDQVGVRFALEVHPTEIAFDLSSAERALQAIGRREAFGFNYDPSHFGYQGVDYVAFIERFEDRIYHAHMKDVWWSDVPKPSGVFGGHLDFATANATGISARSAAAGSTSRR